jgi:hypothetical protein
MDVPADGDTLAFVNVDSVRRRAFGATKQTPPAAAIRRPGGDNAAFARETGVPSMIVVSTDSAYRAFAD